ncbi:MAG: hypothetical protein JO316_10545 [Abitibacteriaceae bacterium]|nr:hypothetical protein [Abditibacteriaceae bacterium]MBV9865781.1 hypothetical protein [Abditibacteriaceae bacterium]
MRKAKTLLATGVIGILGISTAVGVVANPYNPLHTGVRFAQNRDRDDRKGGERHPELRRALRSLQAAKVDLQKGAHDFQGHRAKALDLTNQAIAEVQQALQADKR